MTQRERARALSEATQTLMVQSAAAILQSAAVQSDVTAAATILERGPGGLVVVEVHTQATGRRERFDVRFEAYAMPHVPPGWGWYRANPDRPEFVVGERVRVALEPGVDQVPGVVRAVLGSDEDPRPGYRVNLDGDDWDVERTVAPQAVSRPDDDS